MFLFAEIQKEQRWIKEVVKNKIRKSYIYIPLRVLQIKIRKEDIYEVCGVSDGNFDIKYKNCGICLENPYHCTFPAITKENKEFAIRAF